MQELLDLVRSGGVNCICVKDFSRFSRNAMDSGYFIEQVFPLYGVRFISVSDGFDSSDYGRNDKSEWTVIPGNHPAIISREDFEKAQSAAMIKGSAAVREKRSGGATEKRIKKDGSAIGIFPLYGYVFDENHKAVINPKPAEAIRLIYQMAFGGSTVPQICEALTQAGFPTPGEQKAIDRGGNAAAGKAWTWGAVNNILRELQYTGTAVSGRSVIAAKSADGEPKPMMPRLSPQSEWRLTPNQRPAIIP